MDWAAYWCYTSWTLVDQNEAGDTTTHTFNVGPFNFGDTIWYRFHGNIGAVSSPSDSPIFQATWTFIPPSSVLQTSCDPSGNFFAVAEDKNPKAVVFTAASSFSARSLKILAYKSGTTNICTFEVRPIVAGGVPQGAANPPLASGTLDISGIATGPPGQLIEIPLTTPVALTSGVQYGLCFFGNKSNPDRFYVRYNFENPCPLSYACYSTDFGYIYLQWGAGVVDIWFELWGG
ncbi:hypothetical protein ES705_30413 [subsurface metagenome]